MGTHRYEISVAADPEAVYDLYADLERHPEWESGNLRISRLSSTSVGSGTTFDMNYGRWLTYHARVETADRPRRFVISATIPFGLRSTSQSEFVPDGRGTRVIHVVELRWPIRLAGRVLESLILPPAVVREEMARFKAIAETSPSPAQTAEPSGRQS